MEHNIPFVSTGNGTTTNGSLWIIQSRNETTDNHWTDNVHLLDNSEMGLSFTATLTTHLMERQSGESCEALQSFTSDYWLGTGQQHNSELKEDAKPLSRSPITPCRQAGQGLELQLTDVVPTHQRTASCTAVHPFTQEVRNKDQIDFDFASRGLT